MEIYLKIYLGSVINATVSFEEAYDWFHEDEDINVQVWLDGACLFIHTEKLLNIYAEEGFFGALNSEIV